MKYKLLVHLTSAVIAVVGYQFYDSSTRSTTDVQTEKLYHQIIDQQVVSPGQANIDPKQQQENQEQPFSQFPKQWMRGGAQKHISLKIDQLNAHNIQGIIMINGQKTQFDANLQEVESERIYQAEFDEQLSKNKIIIKIDLLQPDRIKVQQIYQQTKEIIGYDLLARK